MIVVKFEKTDSSELHSAFGEGKFHENLDLLAKSLEQIDVEAFANKQTFREVVALKCVLVKALELSGKINKTYLENK